VKHSNSNTNLCKAASIKRVLLRLRRGFLAESTRSTRIALDCQAQRT
jgi:hypothetical protein